MRPDRVKPTAPPPVIAFFWHPTPLACAGPWRRGRLKWHVGTSGCIARLRFGQLFFPDGPCLCKRQGVYRTTAPLSCATYLLTGGRVLKPFTTPCPMTGPYLETCLHHLSCISTRVGSSLLLQCQKCTALQRGGDSVGTKTGATVVHAAKMPMQYFLSRESVQVQCDGTMADVKLLPVFTSKRSPGCFSDVLHDILEGNPNL